MTESQSSEVDSLDAIIGRAERVSRRWGWLVSLGMLATIAGFVILSLHLNDARVEAVQAGEKAYQLYLSRNREANSSANSILGANALLKDGNIKGAIEILDKAARNLEATTAQPPPPAIEQDTIAAAEPPQTQPEVTSALASASDEGLNVQLDPAPENTKQLVYIQFAGSVERSEIVDLNQALRHSAWNVQGASGERIATAMGLNEVRYSGDTDRDAAGKLAASLSKVWGKEVKARQLSIIKAGTLEVWISR